MILQFSDWLRHKARRKFWLPSLETGRRGEDLAHRFLQAKGFVIVARNYRLPSGDAEADLIAWDGDTLVFVEVKSRESADFGPPERAIGEEKRTHILRVASHYTRKSGTPWGRIRIDIVSIIFSDPPSFEHFRGALSTQRSRSKA